MTDKPGYELRKTRGAYEYKDGDWTYEELKSHRQELIDEKRLVWGALGFEDVYLITAEAVAKEARRLRSPLNWLRRLWARR